MRKKPQNLRLRAELYAAKHETCPEDFVLTVEARRREHVKAYTDGYRAAQRDERRKRK